jgi:putative DNA primase/helicase
MPPAHSSGWKSWACEDFPDHCHERHFKEDAHKMSSIDAPAEQQVQDFLSALYDPADILVFDPVPAAGDRRWFTIADDLDDEDTAAELFSHIKQMNRAGRPAFIGVNTRAGVGRTGAEGTKLARVQFADFDGGITPEQALQAIDRAGLPQPTAIVWSGNGTHCYWALVEPVEVAETWTLNQKWIAVALGSDPAVSDWQRLTRLPGFANPKPEYGAPPPVAKLIACHPERRYSWKDLQPKHCEPPLDDAPPMPRDAYDGPPRPGDIYNETGPEWGEILPMGWRPMGQPKANGMQAWTMGGSRKTATAWDHAIYVWDTDCSILPTGQWLTKFAVYTLLNHGGDYSAAAAALRDEGYGGAGGEAVDFGPARIDDSRTWSEIGIGKLLAERHGSRLLYIGEGKLGWFGWNGKWWARDNGEQAEQLIKECIEHLWEQVPQITDSAAKGRAAKWLTSVSTATRVQGIAKMARIEQAIYRYESPFDHDDFVLNTQSGIVDLRTGALRPHDPAAYCSKVTSCEYAPTATCPRWEQFINEVTCGDTDQAEYLQRVLGYTISGSCREETMFVHVGVGGNGKGTCLETVATLLGMTGHGYATTAPAEMLAVRKFGSPVEASRQVGEIAGARMALGCENDQGVFLNEATLKRLTGRDTVKARDPYLKARDTRPTWTLHLQTNHRPTVKGTDEGLWRRLHCIQWSADFTGEACDTTLKERLPSEEGAGILAWLVHGCVAYLADGLKTPESVRLFTRQYREENDLVGLWIEECCVVAPTARDTSKVLWCSFSSWAKINGYDIGDWNTNRFGRTLSEKRFTRGRLNGQKAWIGISIDQVYPSSATSAVTGAGGAAAGLA